MSHSLSFAKGMRAEPTDAEARLWMHLRAGRLEGLKWKRQVPMGPYILDFVCFAAKLIVEVDGGQHNDSINDKKRDEWCRSQGFVVLRYWNNEVLSNLEGVLVDVLHHATPSPQPLSHEGRGTVRSGQEPVPSKKGLSPLVGERWERGGGSPALEPHQRENRE